VLGSLGTFGSLGGPSLGPSFSNSSISLGNFGLLPLSSHPSYDRQLSSYAPSAGSPTAAAGSPTAGTHAASTRRQSSLTAATADDQATKRQKSAHGK
jgi:hypothetical protein